MADISTMNSLNSFGINSRYILRSTRKEVEVIAFNLVENGARHDNDWVSYIDSEGNEHVKESLNIQFDFKASNALSETFTKIFDSPKYPSTENNRIFETAKELLVHKSYTIDDAIDAAKELVVKTKDLEI